MNNISKYILILSILLLTSNVYNIFLILAPKEERCVYQKVKSTYIYSGKYFFTGMEEKLNKVFILNQKKEKIWSNNNQKEGSFSFAEPIETKSIDELKSYSLCFINDSHKSLTASFDIFKNVNTALVKNEEDNEYDDEDIDNNQNSNLVTVQNIKELNKNIYELRKRVDIIHSDLRSSLVRREGHLESKLNYNI